MNKFLKRTLSLLFASVLLLTMLSAGTVAFGDDLVALNSSNFSDAAFRQVLSEYYDDNGDGYLSAQERKVTIMSLSGMLDSGQVIRNLDGISHFASTLKILRCGDIGLEELDVSSLANLTSLTCQGNELTSLDISMLSNLVTLNCSDNKLTTLNLGSSSVLETVYCYANSLTGLNTSALVNLKSLRCDQNELTDLDISNNSNLIEFNCSSNHLAKLDLSANASLGEVTDYMIGDQIIDEVASIYINSIVVNFGNYNIVPVFMLRNSLEEYGDGAGFDGTNFVAYDVAEIDDGIDYTYYTNLEGSENMTVHINVERSFHQVGFYTDSSFTELVKKSFVEDNGSVNSPLISEVPQCKALDYWSEPTTDVTTDMNVYPIWKDAHIYVPVAFDGDLLTLSCSACGDSITLSFIQSVNAKTGDSNYYDCLDVVSDGYINAKDYAKLSKMF